MATRHRLHRRPFQRGLARPRRRPQPARLPARRCHAVPTGRIPILRHHRGRRTRTHQRPSWSSSRRRRRCPACCRTASPCRSISGSPRYITATAQGTSLYGDDVLLSSRSGSAPMNDPSGPTRFSGLARHGRVSRPWPAEPRGCPLLCSLRAEGGGARAGSRGKCAHKTRGVCGAVAPSWAWALGRPCGLLPGGDDVPASRTGRGGTPRRGRPGPRAAAPSQAALPRAPMLARAARARHRTGPGGGPGWWRSR